MCAWTIMSSHHYDIASKNALRFKIPVNSQHSRIYLFESRRIIHYLAGRLWAWNSISPNISFFLKWLVNRVKTSISDRNEVRHCFYWIKTKKEALASFLITSKKGVVRGIYTEQVISWPQHMGDFTLPWPLGHSETSTFEPSSTVIEPCFNSSLHSPQVIDPTLMPHISHL